MGGKDSGLTRHDGRKHGKDRGGQDVKDEVDPARVVEGAAADKGRDVVAAEGGKVGQENLQDGESKHDDGREDVLAAALAAGGLVGAVEGDLAGEAAHDLKEADVEGRVEGKVGVDLEVAPGVAFPPGGDVVIAP